jgi:hypothetical protein
MTLQLQDQGPDRASGHDADGPGLGPTWPANLRPVPGVTYRQIDHWARRGFLRPEQPVPGSGFVREWPETELRVAEAMGRLVRAGLPPALAERVARGESEVAPGVRILVDA